MKYSGDWCDSCFCKYVLKNQTKKNCTKNHKSTEKYNSFSAIRQEPYNFQQEIYFYCIYRPPPKINYVVTGLGQRCHDFFSLIFDENAKINLNRGFLFDFIANLLFLILKYRKSFFRNAQPSHNGFDLQNKTQNVCTKTTNQLNKKSNAKIPENTHLKTLHANYSPPFSHFFSILRLSSTALSVFEVIYYLFAQAPQKIA